MQMIYLEKDIPRALLVKVLRPIWPGVVWSPLSPIYSRTITDPSLPGERWVRVRNNQCGICATDLSLLNIQTDPELSAVAVPGIQRVYLGHETVGEVIEVGQAVTRFQYGDRVVLEGLMVGSPNCHTLELAEACEYCLDGQDRLCENAYVTEGPARVGGGWGDSYVIHESQLWPVPDELSDDQASLIEPAACALHGVLRRPPQAGEKVLIIGAGIIGLLALQSAKALAPGAHVTVMARYPQQVEAARRLGADEIITSREPYADVARVTDGKYFKAILNRGMVLGGFSVVYDCVGYAGTVWDGLRWTKAQGTFVLIGTSFQTMKVDLSPVYYQEVDLIGGQTFGMEHYQGKPVHTFEMVIDFFRSGDFTDEGLITHRYPFHKIRKAIKTASDKRSGCIKVTITYSGG
jgi:threonine dehydrogenase-like Zn-dependent dehydrogenase